MKELLQDMDKAYTALQRLNLQPTKANMTILMETLNVMEKAYVYIKDQQKEEKEAEENV